MRPSISYTLFPTVRLRVESGGSNAVMCNMCDLEPMEVGGRNVCVEPVEGVRCVWSQLRVDGVMV